MKCETWRKETQRFLLDARGSELSTLSDALPEELRAHADACADCGRRLQALEEIYEGEPGPVEAPPELSTRVMNRIRAEESTRRTRRTRRRASAAPRVIPGWSSWSSPALGRVTAVAATLVLVLGAVLLFRISSMGPAENSVTVHLRLEAPSAQTVSVVGDWNQWDSEANVMRDSDDDGIWEIRLELQEDQVYQYQFIIDDKRWVPDPQAPVHVDDGFGGTNSVLDV